jgi:hypothetical protein
VHFEMRRRPISFCHHRALPPCIHTSTSSNRSRFTSCLCLNAAFSQRSRAPETQSTSCERDRDRSVQSVQSVQSNTHCTRFFKPHHSFLQQYNQYNQYNHTVITIRQSDTHASNRARPRFLHLSDNSTIVYI